jgi:hypothetical protein
MRMDGKGNNSKKKISEGGNGLGKDENKEDENVKRINENAEARREGIRMRREVEHRKR